MKAPVFKENRHSDTARKQKSSGSELGFYILPFYFAVNKHGYRLLQAFVDTSNAKSAVTLRPYFAALQ
jgi:hypothetical protein